MTLKTRQPIAWMAYCLETGGRLFAHTDYRARERGREAYAPHEFVVWPLYTADELADWRGAIGEHEDRNG